MTPSKDVVDEFRELYVRWFAAIPDDRDGFFGRILADDWVYIDFLGVVRGKEEYREYIKAVPPGKGPAEPRDLNVRVFGDVAVVHGEYLVVSGSGETPDQPLRFTAVWLRKPDGWRSLSHHSTAVVEPEH